MFSIFFKRNKISNIKYNKKYQQKLKEIKIKIINGFKLDDYEINFIVNELNDNDKNDLILIYDDILTHLVKEYFNKE